MTTIRIVSNTPRHEDPWGASDHWTRVFRYMSHDGCGRWNDLQITDPRADADWTVVVNHCDGHDKTLIRDRAKTFTLIKEDACVTQHNHAVWDYYSDPRLWAGVWTIPTHWEPFDWSVSLPYRVLATQHPAKSKILSAVQSAKAYHPNHPARVAFVMGWLSKLPDFDLYGRDSYPLACYRGPLIGEMGPGGPVSGRIKDAGVFPYQYHFCAENYHQPNYWSEKIVDAWLAECLPLYSGCPNLEDFYPADSFIRLDLGKPEAALEVVKAAIASGQWEKRLPAIREAKRLCLERYNQWCCVEELVRERR